MAAGRTAASLQQQGAAPHDAGRQIPSDYNQGSGTIISGTAATKATEAALAAYPGVIVDRVVAIGNGDYEVHCIGDNWPHHIFVNQDYQVIGANNLPGSEVAAARQRAAATLLGAAPADYDEAGLVRL